MLDEIKLFFKQKYPPIMEELLITSFCGVEYSKKVVQPTSHRWVPLDVNKQGQVIILQFRQFFHSVCRIRAGIELWF